MKNLKKVVLSILVVLVLANMGNITKVKASEITSQDKDVSFVGTITPTREFYKGEYVKYNDFEVNGYFTTTDNIKIPNDEWKVFIDDAVNNENVNLTLVHLPSFDTGEYKDINYNVKVKTNEFDSKLKSNITSNDMVSLAPTDINALDIIFSNSLGQIIKGTTCYSYKNKNTINYSFVPYVRYLTTENGYNEYDVYKGSFKINENIKLQVLTANYLNLNVSDRYNINISNKIKNSSYVWTSSDKTNVSVNKSNGIIKVVSLGNAIITCKITKPDGTVVILKCEVDAK